jgi:phosphoglycolate phosphatase-like HAD superfamily hydrolase
VKHQYKEVKAILFDLDGTIFDIRERDSFSRFQALNQFGYIVSLEEVRKHYNYGIGRMGVAHKFGIKFSEKEEKEYIKACYSFFMNRKNALKLTKIHDNAYEVLSTLHSNYNLALVTSRDALAPTEEELKQFKIRKFFTLIITREVAAKYHRVKHLPLLPFQEQRKKLYECAIGLIKLNPKNMLSLGDSTGELEPARALGIKTIGVLTGFDSKEDMDRTSIPTIPDLSYLPKILR